MIEKSGKSLMVLSSIIGFILGGGNYVTALLTLEVSFLLVLVCWKNKKKRIMWAIIPIIAKETAAYYGVRIKVVIVDVRIDNKESASKI